MMTGQTQQVEGSPSTTAAEPCSVSVIIAWVNDSGLISAVLAALTREQKVSPHEVIVATRHQGAVVENMRAQYPTVQLIECLAHDTIPTLRAIAIEKSSGQVIAVTEDHCLPCEDWIGCIQRAMAKDVAAVGGPVEQGTFQRLRDWAAFLTEYAFAISPCEAGPTGGLPGNNVAYRRELCDGLVQTLKDQRWESFRYGQIIESGKVFWLDPKMVVSHNRSFDFLYFLSQRFYFCRSYAGMRWANPTLKQRMIYGFGSAVLPPMLWLRSLRVLMKKKRFVLRYVCLSPLISLYYVAGALGEMAGYFFGSQQSLERVE